MTKQGCIFLISLIICIYITPTTLSIESKTQCDPENHKKTNSLKVIFYSRIVPKKNLKFALDLVKEYADHNIILDIYGPIEDQAYWNTISTDLDKYFLNIKYCGSLQKHEIISTISHYDLFILPTLAENFGHVILESLMSGVPVLLSDNTPFTTKNLNGAGWSFPLENRKSFMDIIDKFYKYDNTEYFLISQNILDFLKIYKLSNNEAKLKYINIMFNEKI